MSSRVQSFVSVICSACIVTGITAAVYFPLQDKNRNLENQIRTLRSEISDLGNRISTLTVSSRDLAFPDDLIWSEKSEADAELYLQDAVIDLAVQSGLTPVTFGSSSHQRDSTQKIVSFELEVEGMLTNAYSFLASLENHDPRVAVGTLRIRPRSDYAPETGETLIYLQAAFWAYWGISE